MNICLIGMRGSGKSNLSRRLSVLTKRTVFSTDALISYEQEGQSIEEIVRNAARGWHDFRDLEYQVVRRAARMQGVIIDCGGGVIVDLDSQGSEVYSSRKVGALKRSGIVVWLRGDVDRLVQKAQTKAMAEDPNRPQLDTTQSLKALMEHRLPFYEKAADIILDIDGKKRRDLAVELMKRTSDAAWHSMVMRRGQELD
ncbi:shikimate kinase [Magnetococcus marinus MC-1]|uniref:Shikimate kinase n=1 Tax=Magnetococcus marinus (strain ATCC BAA-1437 / JCM 17883 / MC-1) TaxID=156889 RepID=A0L3S6_MAGMM|nr:shikimate kinase [Magnetococcus marinus]ABK42619.1 shikimate kinase [Magnetococcus marinus MC-1]